MSSPVPCRANANENGHRKRSIARSFSSELGTVDEEENMDANSALEGSSREQTTKEKMDAPLSYSSGNPVERIQTTPCPREVMKTKLRYHFMNPLQKFRARRRKPWKLVLQIVKIVLVTLQICLFGFDRFSLVTFLENNQTALKHLFLKDYQNGQKGVVVYTREQLYENLRYAHEQYSHIRTAPLGTYDYTHMVNRSEPPPLLLCYSYYAAGGIENNTFVFDPAVKQDCLLLKVPFNKEKHMQIKNDTFNLGRLREVRVMFSLNTVNLKNVKAWDKPACYQLGVTILFDNVKYDGRMPVQLHMNNTWLNCQKGQIKGSDSFRTHFIRLSLVIFDAVVIFICTVSLVLCGRSIYRSLKLAKEAAKFFNQDLILGDFTFSDYQEFVSLWFFLIMTSDSLTIIGSIYKMAIDQKDSDFFNVSSLCLGIAVLLVWIGLLRFLGYSKQYNILLITLKAATPSMARFVVCASLLFAGFMFCGWIVLGPFHPKFKTLTVTAECLYSMVNGDDLFNTYAQITKKAPNLVWIFSKVYLYIFIGLFIYVVLSLFIGIIGDTYERLKDMGHFPETKIQRFLHEPSNFGRSIQRRDRTTAAEDIPTIRPRERTDPYAGSRSSETQDPMMNIVSIDSTGAE